MDLFKIANSVAIARLKEQGRAVIMQKRGPVYFHKMWQIRPTLNQELNGNFCRFEKLPHRGHNGGQRSTLSKLDNGRIAPRWKACDSGNSPTLK